MFTIETHGVSSKTHRLVAREQLNVGDFVAVARQLGVAPARARKIGFVSARRARARETVETRWNGTETTNVAEPGDWVVTNLSRQKQILRDDGGHENTYVIQADRFAALYVADAGKTAFGAIYRANSVVETLRLTGGFEILAPWGEMQHAEDGYLLLNGSEVYGNARDTFDATYEHLR